MNTHDKPDNRDLPQSLDGKQASDQGDSDTGSFATANSTPRAASPSTVSAPIFKVTKEAEAVRIKTESSSDDSADERNVVFPKLAQYMAPPDRDLSLSISDISKGSQSPSSLSSPRSATSSTESRRWSESMSPDATRSKEVQPPALADLDNDSPRRQENPDESQESDNQVEVPTSDQFTAEILSLGAVPDYEKVSDQDEDEVKERTEALIAENRRNWGEKEAADRAKEKLEGAREEAWWQETKRHLEGQRWSDEDPGKVAKAESLYSSPLVPSSPDQQTAAKQQQLDEQRVEEVVSDAQTPRLPERSDSTDRSLAHDLSEVSRILEYSSSKASSQDGGEPVGSAEDSSFGDDDRSSSDNSQYGTTNNIGDSTPRGLNLSILTSEERARRRSERTRPEEGGSEYWVGGDRADFPTTPRFHTWAGVGETSSNQRPATAGLDGSFPISKGEDLSDQEHGQPSGIIPNHESKLVIPDHTVSKDIAQRDLTSSTIPPYQLFLHQLVRDQLDALQQLLYLLLALGWTAHRWCHVYYHKTRYGHEPEFVMAPPIVFPSQISFYILVMHVAFLVNMSILVGLWRERKIWEEANSMTRMYLLDRMYGTGSGSWMNTYGPDWDLMWSPWEVFGYVSTLWDFIGDVQSLVWDTVTSLETWKALQTAPGFIARAFDSPWDSLALVGVRKAQGSLESISGSHASLEIQKAVQGFFFSSWEPVAGWFSTLQMLWEAAVLALNDIFHKQD